MAKLDVTYAYAADIVKSERDPATGDLMVYGKATGPDLDLDGQRCDPAWLKTAMPAWMEWGNVREQHSNIAAGVGVELTEDNDDWMLLSRCVDPGTAKKIEAGVLKGYSISVKNGRVVKTASARNGLINGGDIVEISYVDRPCLPTAKMTICKSAGLAEDGASIEIEDGVTDTPLEPVEATAEVEVKAYAADSPSVERGDYGPGRVVDEVAKAIGADLLRRLRGVVPETVDITKAASDDIATAQQAIAVIAGLIQSEAAGLAAGQMCEAEQISCLLRAVDALCWFQTMEAAEPAAPEGGEGLDAMAAAQTSDMDMNGNVISMAAVGDTLKADVETLVKAAVTEATKAHEAELATLRAELVKVNARPIPGGPILARPRAVIAEAGERAAALVTADKYESIAKSLAQTDPRASREYREAASALRRQKD